MDVERVLDWRSQHDERSRDYPVRSILPDTVPLRARMWQEGIVLDQGAEGACVGFGWTAELLAEPFTPNPQPSLDSAQRAALRYYKLAQKADDWEGENYSGTSVLAGARIMKQYGYIEQYRWCFSVEDLRDAVIFEGPAVIGVPWYEGMYQTRPDGLVAIGGNQVGGHCILVTGYNPSMQFGDEKFEVFRWRNSWGASYGLNGSGYVKIEDMKNLLSGVGEACIPMGRRVPRFEEPSTFQNHPLLTILDNIWSLFRRK